MVDKDRIKGAAEQAKGKAKEWTGKATGDKKTEVEGKADQVKGKVQNAVGGAKDAMRDKWMIARGYFVVREELGFWPILAGRLSMAARRLNSRLICGVTRRFWPVV
jgi:uncharacterized protein YjbJ (UPF0337 family)